MIPLLQQRGYQVHYIGDRNGMERRLTEGTGVEFHGISSGKLRRYLDLKNLSDPFRVMAGVAQSLAQLRRLKPAAIFSKGGFVSVPVAFAARLAHVPLVLHESDMTPGLANKLALGSAMRVCTTFPETAAHLGAKARHTGTPIRAALYQGDAERGLRLCGWQREGLPVLLSMGGSQGAGAINAALRAALPRLLKSFRVVHLCGKGNVDDSLKATPGYAQFEYVGAELPDLLAATALVVSRAGANSIFEFLALRKPMLLIPLPLSASRGDQIDNAKSFAGQGFARVLPQENLTADTLYDALMDTWAKAPAIGAAMQAAGAPDGTMAVLEEIEKAANSKR